MTDSNKGNLMGISKGDVITIERAGLEPDARYVVLAAGESTHRLMEEGGDPKTDWFKVLDSEVLEIVEQVEKKGTTQGTARDRTGEMVKRVVYVPGTGYMAHLQTGQSVNTRIARLALGTVLKGEGKGSVAAIIQGTGETVPSASLGSVYMMQFQTPRNRKAIATDPANAPDPSTLGLSAASIEKD